MRLFLGASVIGVLGSLALHGTVYGSGNPAGDWLSWEQPIALGRMLSNISRSDTAPGIVVASPQRQNPDYYFHWIRDAALTFAPVVDLYKKTPDLKLKNQLRALVLSYIEMSRRNQVTVTMSGLGEPKFHVDGSAYNEPWGRPQNDGPALRAITLSEFSNTILTEGDERFVRERLYDGRLPTQSLIKTDLEFVSHHWKDDSYDLWEEVKGDHFYTRMVQRKALVLGARLAYRLGDFKAGDWYLRQADGIQNEMERFWRPDLGVIAVTLNRSAGVDYKVSQLDSAVVLGSLHGDLQDGFYSPSSERVLASLTRQTEVFRSLYSINQKFPDLGAAIGRYPEDRYAGTSFNQGNPWVLTTLAFAEVCYKAAQSLRAEGHVTVTPLNAPLFNSILTSAQLRRVAAHEVLGKDTVTFERLVSGLKELGDSFVERVKKHANPDGSLSEQIDRHSGWMTSAADLTWNYAAILTAESARSLLP